MISELRTHGGARRAEELVMQVFIGIERTIMLASLQFVSSIEKIQFLFARIQDLLPISQSLEEGRKGKTKD
jgi:hypothetical protein